MAVSKQASGFECEFVEKPPQIIQTECLICLLILREPYQVICCGKSYCRSCIERVKALDNPCPHCNERNFTDFPNKGHQQLIYQFKVRCNHQKEGCEWTGELGELDNHLNLLDPQPDNKLKGCVFVMVKCTHCSESHQRQHINHHQNEVCPKRPFTCEYCKAHESTFEDIATNHWPVCECYPVECKCGGVFQRKNLESHVAEYCPLTAIKCDFHYAGCEVKLSRKDMGEHLHVELVKYTSMMATSYQQQITSQQNVFATYKQQQDQDRESLMKENETKSNQISELVKENEALKQRVTELEKETERIKLWSGIGDTPPVDMVIPNFRQIKETGNSWYSPPFYTHPRGYKLCVKYNTFSISIRIYVHLMRGEFDDELKWPLKGELTIQQLRQDGSNVHYTTRIKLTSSYFYSRVTKGDKNQSADATGLNGFAIIYNQYTDAEGSFHFKIVNFKNL